jgi:hypothetical protein
MSSNHAIAVRMASAAMEACACPPIGTPLTTGLNCQTRKAFRETGHWYRVGTGVRTCTCPRRQLIVVLVGQIRRPLPGESPDSHLRELIPAASRHAGQPEKANYLVTLD